MIIGVGVVVGVGDGVGVAVGTTVVAEGVGVAVGTSVVGDGVGVSVGVLVGMDVGVAVGGGRSTKRCSARTSPEGAQATILTAVAFSQRASAGKRNAVWKCPVLSTTAVAYAVSLIKEPSRLSSRMKTVWRAGQWSPTTTTGVSA